MAAAACTVAPQASGLERAAVSLTHVSGCREADRLHRLCIMLKRKLGAGGTRRHACACMCIHARSSAAVMLPSGQGYVLHAWCTRTGSPMPVALVWAR